MNCLLNLSTVCFSETLVCCFSLPAFAAAIAMTCLSFLSLQPLAQALPRWGLRVMYNCTGSRDQETAKLLLLPCPRPARALLRASPAWHRAQEQPGMAGHDAVMAATLGTAHWRNPCCSPDWDVTGVSAEPQRNKKTNASKLPIILLAHHLTLQPMLSVSTHLFFCPRHTVPLSPAPPKT